MRRIHSADPWDWVTDEDRLRYREKWIVAYRGRIRGAGNTLGVALRRAKLPRNATPYIEWVSPPEPWFL